MASSSMYHLSLMGFFIFWMIFGTINDENRLREKNKVDLAKKQRKK
jgi:hypothetical protein